MFSLKESRIYMLVRIPSVASGANSPCSPWGAKHRCDTLRYIATPR